MQDVKLKLKKNKKTDIIISLYTFNKYMFLRFTTIMMASFLLAIFFPFVNNQTDSSGNIIHPMLIFSLLITFLINRALERKKTISLSVSTELTRLRRIHHITEGIKDNAWKEKIFMAINNYQEVMSNNFFDFQNTLRPFRIITHLIYNYNPKNNHENLLLNDLFESTRELALERQKREVNTKSGLVWYSWLVMTTYALMLILLLLSNRQSPNFSVVSVGSTIAGILIVMDYLYRLNRFSKYDTDLLQQEYKQNLLTIKNCPLKIKK